MEKINQKEINSIYQSIPLLRKFPSEHFWIDYDREVDVLYINFDKLEQATDSILQPNNVLVRQRNNKIIGLTILNASKFKIKNKPR